MLHHRCKGRPANRALSPILITAVATTLGGLATTALAQSTPMDLGLYNTGVDESGNLLALGEVDPHYLAGEAGETLNPAFVEQGIPAPPWMSPGPDANWIGPSQSVTQPPNTNFLYETTFDWTGLNASEMSRTVIYGQYATDDQLVDVHINGNSQGYAGGDFSSYRPFAVGGTTGLNTLQFTVSNGAGSTTPVDNPHGFRARFTNVAVSSDVTQSFASESFNYAAGTLTGHAGGSGFSGAWGHRSDLASAVVTTPGLDDIGSVNGIATSGNKATSGTTTASSQSFRAFDLENIPAEYRDANGNIGSPGTSLWMSVLLERESDEPAPFFGISTFLVNNPDLIDDGSFDPAAAGLDEQLFIGAGSNDAVWKLQGNGYTGFSDAAIDTASSDGADLLVVRIDFLDDGIDDGDRMPDAAHLWVNPDETGLGTPNVADADAHMFGINGSGVLENLHFNALRITGGGVGNIDEFRMGSDYASVVLIPEPATLGLLGTAGLLALRRRRA